MLEIISGHRGWHERGLPAAPQRDETSAPFLILQEGVDYPIPYEHPRRMVAALQSTGVQVSYSWFPTYTHDSWFS